MRPTREYTGTAMERKWNRRRAPNKESSYDYTPPSSLVQYMAVLVDTPVRRWNSCDGRTTDTGMFGQGMKEVYSNDDELRKS